MSSLYLQRSSFSLSNVVFRKDFFTLLLLCGVLVGCPVTSTPPRLVLLGQPEHVSLAANLLGAGGVKTQQTTTLKKTDIVFFVVSAIDGPMPQTREQIEAIRGQAHGEAAIFLVKVSEQDDPELIELVLLETKNLLTTNSQPKVATMPVLYDNDPNIILTVRGFLTTP
jgi:hypothetical protein